MDAAQFKRLLFQTDTLHIVPPHGHGLFPPSGIDVMANLSDGRYVSGRTIHLNSLTSKGYHCVVFVADWQAEIYDALFFGEVPAQLGGFRPEQPVVVSWHQFHVER